MSDDPKEKKKDLTGLHELPQAEPSPDEQKDPFAMDELQPIEKIDAFESIDQIGMIDHPAPVEDAPPMEEPPAPAEEAPPVEAVAPEAEVTPFEQPTEQSFELSSDAQTFDSSANDQAFQMPEAQSFENPTDFQTDSSQSFGNDQSFTEPLPEPAQDQGFGTTPPTVDDPFAFDAPAVSVKTLPSSEPLSFGEPPKTLGGTSKVPANESQDLDASPPMDYLESMKSYSEKTRETSFDPRKRYPFHLLIQGAFDPYARDKLLLFITENPVGTNSSELDLQIKSERVLLPRISEYAGIKLIQDLRDTGLTFRLAPSSVDEDEVTSEAPSVSIHYSNATSGAGAGKNIPILPKDQFDQKIYEVIDTIQMVQFLKAEMLEVEKSDLFQELLTRMTSAIKRKANALGAVAITNVHHKVDPMRLPSQYKLELNATLLKKAEA